MPNQEPSIERKRNMTKEQYTGSQCDGNSTETALREVVCNGGTS